MVQHMNWYVGEPPAGLKVKVKANEVHITVPSLLLMKNFMVSQVMWAGTKMFQTSSLDIISSGPAVAVIQVVLTFCAHNLIMCW